MPKKQQQQSPIAEIDLKDVHQLYDNFSYEDGEIYFADNITSIPNLSNILKVNFIVFVFVLDGELFTRHSTANATTPAKTTPCSSPAAPSSAATTIAPTFAA